MREIKFRYPSLRVIDIHLYKASLPLPRSRCFDTLHCGSLIFTCQTRVRTLNSRCFDTLHCGSLIFTFTHPTQDHKTLRLFRYPSLRVIDIHWWWKRWRPITGLGFDTLHCGSLIFTRANKAVTTAKQLVSIPFIA